METVYAKRNGKSDKVDISYIGDKIIKAKHSDAIVTFYFDK